MITSSPAYAALYAATTDTIKDFRNDLEKIDAEAIDRYPGRPFIHFARESGTDLITLLAQEDYPAIGETVPYLFGRVDRLALCRKHLEYVKAVRKTYGGETGARWHHWDGDRLRAIDADKAEELVRIYVERTLKELTRTRRII